MTIPFTTDRRSSSLRSGPGQSSVGEGSEQGLKRRIKGGKGEAAAARSDGVKARPPSLPSFGRALCLPLQRRRRDQNRTRRLLASRNVGFPRPLLVERSTVRRGDAAPGGSSMRPAVADLFADPIATSLHPQARLSSTQTLGMETGTASPPTALVRPLPLAALLQRGLEAGRRLQLAGRRRLDPCR
jgi:hypothetical protein